MGTRSVKIAGRLSVAAGPQSVTVSFKDGVGEWFIVAAGSSSNHGHWFGQPREPFGLEAGQTLEVEGHGILVVTAETFSSAFEALPAAE